MSLRPISLPQALEPYTGAVFPATRRSVAPHCSPDGSRIAFASTSRAGEQFWIGEPERGDPVMESRLDPGTSIATLDWFDVERLLVSVLDAGGARRGPVRRRHIVAHHPGACRRVADADRACGRRAHPARARSRSRGPSRR